MRKGLFFLLLFCGQITGFVAAQVPADSVSPVVTDSIGKTDTAGIVINQTPVKNSTAVSRAPLKNSWTLDSSIRVTDPRFSREILKRHPYFNFSVIPQATAGPVYRKVYGKEFIFYLLVLLLIFLALLRRAFPKYFSDLFRLFFRTTLKQRQLREQLVQTPLPSLLLNGFFVVSGGLLLAFLFQHYDLNPSGSFWLLYFYCCVGLAAAYLVKFIGLKMLGWLFRNQEAADSYIFVVFIVNKMIGILALPVLVLLAFATDNLYTSSLSLAWCLLGGLLGYRMILTYGAVRNQVKVNPFHFFLYLCAFEIAPLLLVYKALLLYFGITA